MTKKQQWREMILILILYIGAITLSFFSFVYFLKGEYLYATLEAVAGLVIWLSIIWAKIKHDYIWPSRIAWGGVQFIITLILFSGGLAGTGLIWWCLLPIISFIIFGDKSGIKAILVGLIVLSAVTLANYLKFIPSYFSVPELLQTGAMIIVVSFIMYFYEKISEESKEEATQKSSELEILIAQKAQTEARLVENLKSLQIEKEQQAKIRSATLNLLEDSQELEKQLQAEKENVEKKIEERTLELTNTKAKLDSSIENLPLGFLMTDVSENYIVTNALANSILGGRTEKENLANLKNIVRNQINLDSYIKQCGIEKRGTTLSDIELNGRFYQFLLSPILTKNQDQSCIGIVVLAQDITEAKILDRSKDEFFSIASHELRTPLTAIRGNTSMILEYFADSLKDPELKSMIDDVHQSSIRLINIVNDFLNVSRLEQRRMVYDMKEFDIEELIPSTIKEYLLTGHSDQVTITNIPPSSRIPAVLGDSDKVRQVLINLLGNALKFTKVGSVTISAESDDKFVKIFVSDTGTGIPLAQQNLLFHKFQQAGASIFTRDTSGGSGLGLYISKMMIEGMGGEVKLEKSEEGKGSVFSFSLPISSNYNPASRLTQIGL